MSRLWDKGDALDAAVERLTTGRDPELDLRLVRADALASAAHATMLQEIGVLKAEELDGLRAELGAIAADAAGGRFTIERADEDCHTAIENRLTRQLGEAGRRIHTGRSRNDQVIAALRLWGREALVELTDQLLAVARILTELAATHAETSMPGYTHTRQAMTTTLGHFFGAYAENLLEHLDWLDTAYDHVNRSPLGSASGYGVALALDRRRVAELLGFAKLQRNTLAVQNDRGRTEAMVLGVAAAITSDLGRLARDLISYSDEAHGFVTLAAKTTTGSSIMPQKRNPDALEIIRAAAARCRHLAAQIGDVYGGVGAGYHRDLQLTKEPFLEGMVLATDCLATLRPVLEALSVDVDRCRDAVEPTTAATDGVYQRVAAGMPFRDAYKHVAEHPDDAFEGDPTESWRARTHTGAPGDTFLGHLEKQQEVGLAWLKRRRAEIEKAWKWFEQDGQGS